MNGALRVLVAIVALALGLAGSASAAAPRLIMVSGDSLAEPLLISGAEDVFTLYGAFFEGRPVDRSEAAGRPSLRLGLFWNNLLWEPYVEDGRLDELRFEQANQFGRFYPATEGKPALVDVPGYGQWPKVVNDRALRILEAHGVPLEVGGNASRGTWEWVAVGGLGLSVIALVFLASHSSRRSAT
jgi:hypothetical protein